MRSLQKEEERCVMRAVEYAQESKSWKDYLRELDDALYYQLLNLFYLRQKE